MELTFWTNLESGCKVDMVVKLHGKDNVDLVTKVAGTYTHVVMTGDYDDFGGYKLTDGSIYFDEAESDFCSDHGEIFHMDGTKVFICESLIDVNNLDNNYEYDQPTHILEACGRHTVKTHDGFIIKSIEILDIKKPMHKTSPLVYVPIPYVYVDIINVHWKHLDMGIDYEGNGWEAGTSGYDFFEAERGNGHLFFIGNDGFVTVFEDGEGLWINRTDLDKIRSGDINKDPCLLCNRVAC